MKSLEDGERLVCTTTTGQLPLLYQELVKSNGQNFNLFSGMSSTNIKTFQTKCIISAVSHGDVIKPCVWLTNGNVELTFIISLVLIMHILINIVFFRICCF